MVEERNPGDVANRVVDRAEGGGPQLPQERGACGARERVQIEGRGGAVC